jgi:hypothetical protein
MKEIGRIYQLKEGSIGELSMNLGANVGCVFDGDGNKCGTYLQQTILMGPLNQLLQISQKIPN